MSQRELISYPFTLTWHKLSQASQARKSLSVELVEMPISRLLLEVDRPRELLAIRRTTIFETETRHNMAGRKSDQQVQLGKKVLLRDRESPDTRRANDLPSFLAQCRNMYLCH